MLLVRYLLATGVYAPGGPPCLPLQSEIEILVRIIDTSLCHFFLNFDLNIIKKIGKYDIQSYHYNIFFYLI